MKTREEVEALKGAWRRDPWEDLGSTEGFEEYRDELAEYEKAARAEWEAKHKADVEAKQRKWYSLELNESFFNTPCTQVMRVPGGWFVTSYEGNEAETAMSQSSAFVPFNNEFMKGAAA